MFDAKSGKNSAGITNLEKESRHEVSQNIISLLTWNNYILSINALPSFIE